MYLEWLWLFSREQHNDCCHSYVLGNGKYHAKLIETVTISFHHGGILIMVTVIGNDKYHGHDKGYGYGNSHACFMSRHTNMLTEIFKL